MKPTTPPAPPPLTPPLRFLLRFVEPERLIIVGAIVVAALSPDHREIVIAGLLGFLTKGEIDRD